MTYISIIIPIYNSERHLEECLKSVCSQTFKEIEIILVNDGSTDGSEAICRKWKKVDKRIKYILQKNRGVSCARNTGIESSKGEYITFIDSDDTVSKHYCEYLLEYCKDNIDLVALGMARKRGEKILPIRHRVKKGIYNASALKDSVIDDGTMSGFTLQSVCSVLYRRSLLIDNHIRFKKEIRYNEDGLFNSCYVFALAKKVYFDFGKIVYFYRVNEDSATNTVDLLGEKYIFDMNMISVILTQVCGNGEMIQNQLRKREVSIMISQLLFIARNNIPKRVIASIIDFNSLRRMLRYIDFQKLNFRKKFLYILLYTNNYTIIKNILRLVL